MADAQSNPATSPSRDVTVSPPAEPDDPSAGPLSIEGARVLGSVRAGLFGTHEATHIDRFVVLRRLGAGGMGEVMLAYDPELDRNVAIKLVRHEFGEATTGVARDAGLLREARAAARLQHPNIVAIFEIGRWRDRLFVAMEHIEGQTLRAWSRERSRSVGEVLRVFEQAGRGLQAAHASGLVHRDFKPDNVLVGVDGRVRVVDFGIASLCDDRSADGSGRDSSSTPGPVGTPRYMAPEQFMDTAVDARADQFAFCVSLWECLAGAPPFASSGGALQLATRILEGRFEPPPRRMPRRLMQALARGLRAEPSRRFVDMQALLDELARIRNAGRRRAGLAAALGAVIVGGVAVRVFTPGPVGCTDADAGSIFADEADRASWSASVAKHSESLANGERAVATLDDFSLRWHAAHDEACSATHERGERSTAVLDARMSCLQRLSTRARTLIDMLAATDRAGAWRAIDAIAELPLPEHCLQQDQSAAPDACTTDVALQLDRAANLHGLGNVADGLATARDAVAAARECGRPGPLAEARTLAAIFAADAGDADADQQLSRAATAALGDDVPAAIARASARLAQLQGAERGRAGEGRAWAEIAAAAAQRAGDDDLITDVDLVQARVELELGDLETAAGLAATALARRRSERGEDHPSVAEALTLSAWVEQYREHWDEAMVLHQQAIEIRSRWYPPDHPAFAASLNAMSSILRKRGDFDAAEANLRRAVEILERSLGPEHRELGAPLGNLADLLAQGGHTDEAIVILARVERIARRDDNWRLLEAVDVIRGVAYAESGRLDEAELAWRRVLELRTAKYGENDGATSIAHVGLCRVLTMRERFTEAMDECRRAIAIDGANLGPEHVELIETSRLFAEAARGAGQTAAAREALERARRIAQDAGLPDRIAAIVARLRELDEGVSR